MLEWLVGLFLINKGPKQTFSKSRKPQVVGYPNNLPPTSPTLSFETGENEAKRKASLWTSLPLFAAVFPCVLSFSLEYQAFSISYPNLIKKWPIIRYEMDPRTFTILSGNLIITPSSFAADT